MTNSDFNLGHMIYVERNKAGLERSEFAKLCYLTPDASNWVRARCALTSCMR